MEEWKQVIGYEGRYEVSKLGDIRTDLNSPHRNSRIHRGKFLHQRMNKNGYLRVSFNLDGVKRSRNVHLVVLEAFKGLRPEGKVARHKDGNSKNNASDNLEWSTQKENIADKIIHGTDNKGEKHQNAVLTNQDVIVMRAMKEVGYSNVWIANCFLVTPVNVGYVVNRKSWTHI